MHPEPTTDPNANFLPAVDRAILMEGLEGTTRSHSHVHLRPYSCYSTPPGHPISPPPVQEPQVTQCEMYFLSKLHHQCAWKETELLTKRKLNDTTDQDSGAELFLTVSVLRTRLKLCTPILPITCTHTQTHTNTHQSEKAGSARTQKRITICFLLDCTAWTDPEGKGGGKRTVLQASITFAELLAHYLDVKRAERPAENRRRHGRIGPGARCDRSGSRTKRNTKKTRKKRGDRADCNVNFSLLSPDMSDGDDGGRPSTELSNHLTLPCWQWSQT